jgi:hypothetical protein
MSFDDLIRPHQQRPAGLLTLGCERRNGETDRENDREPDQPHGHLGLSRRLALGLARQRRRDGAGVPLSVQ